MTLRIGQLWGFAAAKVVTGAMAAAVAVVLGAGCTATGETYDPGAPGGGSGGANAGSGGSAATGTGGGAPVGTGGAGAGSGGASVSGSGGSSPSARTGGSSPGSGGGVPGTGGAASGGTGGGAISGGSGGSGTPAGPVTRLILPWMDNFEANAAGGGAAGWVHDPDDAVGKWSVVMDGDSKVLQEQATVNAASFMVGGDSAWADQKVEAKVKFATVTSSSLALVAARFVDFDNYYFLHLKGDGSLKIRKRIVVGTSTTTLDVLSFKSGAALTAGTWYTVAIEIKGTVVTAYLNGTAVGTMTEAATSIPRGGIALGFQDATGGAFDEVKVTRP